MGKYVWIILVLIFVNGCGSKEGEPKPMVSNDSERTDFVPEHVRKSTIEVVPH
ncbi:hypothetical protein KKC13_04765 [bacterium]|nr:hypothetical protein [bacterium]MBU1958539.1 hypothetical protein [bacterium]